MEVIVVAVLALLIIAAATLLADRLGVAAPLLLVVAGIGVAVLPGMPTVEIDPEWILAGVLPPLLFSSAVAMPAMDFRREFAAIGGLSVVLVLLTTAVLGLVLSWLVPGLGLAGGIALGAILSPTDAVATSIVRKVGVTPRIVTVLEGESLLNDATALVVLRAAIAASATAVSVGGVVADFAIAVVVAVLIGLIVGRVGLLVRSRVQDATVNTVLSFVTPFAASVPAEELGASGLVAAVVAGLVTGQGAIRYLTPQHRLSDTQNWRTVELVLEGGIFLVMGLELTAVLADLQDEGGAIGVGVALAALALALTVLVRAAYVAPLIALLGRSARRGEAMRPTLEEFGDRLDAGEVPRIRGRAPRLDRPGGTARFRTRIQLKIADIDHFLTEPLGPREGAVIVWAGMRGAVTLAAAQTLPADTPHRSLLVFVAFVVAAASLLLQGGTLGLLVRWVKPARAESSAAELAELRARMFAASREVLDRHAGEPLVDELRRRLDTRDEPPDISAGAALWMEMIEARRAALLAARAEGTFDSAALTAALDDLDAEQIGVEIRTRSD